VVTYFLFASGFVILLVGANLLVDGASSIGRKMDLSPVVIGFTIVALGTSLPELFINIFASIGGNTDLAVSNVLGSNIINTLFIIGAAAVIFPIKSPKKTTNSLIPISLASALILGLFANFSVFPFSKANTISRIEGGVMVLLIIGFLIYSYHFAKSEKDEQATPGIKEMSLFKSLIFVAAGIAGLYFGGNWVVDGATFIASEFGISQALIGITIVAVATSLPELVTSMVAALKKNAGLALGNALGSNIFNVFLVLGVSALIKPLPFTGSLNVDLGMVIISNLFLFAAIKIGKGKMVSRGEGVIFMLIYIGYIIYSIMQTG
jgi:cation:H+ antiporter